MILELTKEDVKNLKNFFDNMGNKVEPYNIDNIIKKIYEEAELEEYNRFLFDRLLTLERRLDQLDEARMWREEADNDRRHGYYGYW